MPSLLSALFAIAVQLWLPPLQLTTKTSNNQGDNWHDDNGNRTDGDVVYVDDDEEYLIVIAMYFLYILWLYWTTLQNSQ